MILDGSWVDFGKILGPSWEASWGQVGTKIRKMRVQRRCQKICRKSVTQVYASVRRFTQKWGGGLPIINQSYRAIGQQPGPHNTPLGHKARWRINDDDTDDDGDDDAGDGDDDTAAHDDEC